MLTKLDHSRFPDFISGPYDLFQYMATLFEEGFYMDNWGHQGYTYFGFAPSHSESHKVISPDQPLLQLRLRELIARSDGIGLPERFPFEGGVVSMVGYNCGAEFESFPKRKHHNESHEDFALALYDQILIYDHSEQTYYLSVPKQELRQIFSLVDTSHPTILDSFDELLNLAAEKRQPEAFVPSNLHLKESRQTYGQWVEQTVDYIGAGDIFQANLAHPLSFDFEGSPLELYGRMRRHNPSPYGGVYFKPGMYLLSNSPELLFSNIQGKMVTRPIAGTRPRSAESDEDEANRAELFLSEKEQAEHIMLVDLERNDLGRVAKMGSVVVEELMVCEAYQNVFHIVSQVVGQLREGLDSVDVLRALFPGGTITGAPKIRSMEIIDEFENHDRLYYTGSMGWFGPQGDAVLNILIRSLNISMTGPEMGHGRLHVGAGVVADSIADKEFDETLAKASAWMKFLGDLNSED